MAWPAPAWHGNGTGAGQSLSGKVVAICVENMRCRISLDEHKTKHKARQEICWGHKNFAKKYWPTLLAAKLKRDLQSESTRVSLCQFKAALRQAWHPLLDVPCFRRFHAIKRAKSQASLKPRRPICVFGPLSPCDNHQNMKANRQSCSPK